MVLVTGPLIIDLSTMKVTEVNINQRMVIVVAPPLQSIALQRRGSDIRTTTSQDVVFMHCFH